MEELGVVYCPGSDSVREGRAGELQLVKLSEASAQEAKPLLSYLANFLVPSKVNEKLLISMTAI